jgi:hypothetical protein
MKQGDKPMKRRFLGVPIAMPLAAVLVFILGLLAGPFIQSRATEQQLAQNVLLSALPFILIFVSIILAFMTLIWIIAHQLNDRIPSRIYRPIEIALIAGIVLGIIAMFQPWTFSLFKPGFYILFASTIGFTVWSHVRPAHQEGANG